MLLGHAKMRLDLPIKLLRVSLYIANNGIVYSLQWNLLFVYTHRMQQWRTTNVDNNFYLMLEYL